MEEGDIFLEEYNGQSVDELIALQRKKDSAKVLSETELTILAVEALEREVNNGGFSQFFYNSPVEYVPIIVKSLKAIGCNEVADLTKKAIDLLDIDSLEPEKIKERMNPYNEELEKALGELDNIYYSEIKDTPNYALFEYIKNNIDKISLF